MDILFGIIFITLSVFSATEKNQEQIVPLVNEREIEIRLKGFDIKTFKSVGNHGRYGNVGLDYEYFKTGEINSFAWEKGLRVYDNNDVKFLYIESDKIKKFIRAIENKNPKKQVL